MKSIDQITASEALEALKKLAIDNIQPYIKQAGRKNFEEARIRINHSTTASEVLGYYNAWQQKLHYKQIAQLPDLHQKPGTRKNAA